MDIRCRLTYRARRTTALVVLIVGILNLVFPYGGYVLVGGESMAPAVPAGCSLASAHDWDGESSLEGKVVAYEPQAIDVTGPKVRLGGSTDADVGGWLAHRVIAEYESYNSSEADHYLYQDGLLAREDLPQRTFVATDMTMEEAKALEGRHVLVVKGDNRRQIDSELVPAENVHGVVSTERHVKLLDMETWPCSAVAS
ncbi:hypothetical protein [Natrinema sp. 1APR25-10V2]|uniref:hypothetical protein n=1 Tax=Natrinema sp. 1APR25-10V2 TaxID=2951081 RepID=UPI002875A50D|nr:hypothetical protein [Natrinema sp. 1APR25-10V2]MDS0476551.1 hypothetical protein [Natrinema sp. 1APR25-10V2]